MDTNNQISKVGFVDNDFLQGCHIANPDINNHKHLICNVKYDEMTASVGCGHIEIPTTSSNSMELLEATDNQLTPFVATTIPTNEDTNLTLEELTTSDFDGSFESMVEIEKIVDNTLSEAQWNALPYYATQADLSMDVEVSYLVV